MTDLITAYVRFKDPDSQPWMSHVTANETLRHSHLPDGIVIEKRYADLTVLQSFFPYHAIECTEVVFAVEPTLPTPDVATRSAAPQW